MMDHFGDGICRLRSNVHEVITERVLPDKTIHVGRAQDLYGSGVRKLNL